MTKKSRGDTTIECEGAWNSFIPVTIRSGTNAQSRAAIFSKLTKSWSCTQSAIYDFVHGKDPSAKDGSLPFGPESTVQDLAPIHCTNERYPIM